MPATFDDGIVVKGDARITGDIEPKKSRSSLLAMEELACFVIPWGAWRVHDAYQTMLPAAAAADDLGLVGGTVGTNHPSLQGIDFGQTSETQYGRAQVILPDSYVAGQTVKIRIHAGVKVLSDTSATIDLNVYHCDEDMTLQALGDICETAAQSCNAVTYADLDFVITPTNLSPGDQLDVKLTAAGVDAATAAADVTIVIGSTQLLCDVR